MSRLKKLVKNQNHQQFVLQQLASNSRVSDDIKQFHSEQVEYADRNGIAKALNFLLSLIQSGVIPTSDQIRSQVSKLVSLLRIRDELQLHEQIHKRELGIGQPLKLLRECPIEFPHWDEIFVMLKMKKYSVTCLEDHRARQDLIASILRREAEIERKKTIEAEAAAISQAQKAAAEQSVMQKALETAREKEQRALEAAKEKELRALDAAREKEQRALELAREKERKAFEKEEQIKLFQQQQHEAQIAKELKHEQARLDAQNRKSKTEDAKIKVPNEDSNIYATALEKIVRTDVNLSANSTSCAQTDIVYDQSPLFAATESSTPLQDLKPAEFRVKPAEQPQLGFDISEQWPPNGILSSPCQSPKSIGGSPRQILNNTIPSSPCQSPKCIGGPPQQTSRYPEVQEAINHSNDSQLLLPFERNSDSYASPRQQNLDLELSSPESIRKIPFYGPWRPFVSSSRFLPPVDAAEMNVSPYEMALNLSCLAAVHSLPVLHGAATMKNRAVIASIGNSFGEFRVPKHLVASNALPQFHHAQASAKLLEDMNFEEVQVDRALRSLRRCTDRSSKISMCAYDDILLHQRKLISLLLPVMQESVTGGKQKSDSQSFETRDPQSTHPHNIGSELFVVPRHEPDCSNTNRLPLKTNLAAQRRQVLLAKCSGSRFFPPKIRSSSSVDVLHLESMAKMISNHSRGDPTLWKSAEHHIELSRAQNCRSGNKNCEEIIGEVIGSFGSSNYAARSLPLTNFAQKIKSSLNRSFRERYSVAGKSSKR